jgi:hypothetical protein
MNVPVRPGFESLWLPNIIVRIDFVDLFTRAIVRIRHENYRPPRPLLAPDMQTGCCKRAVDRVFNGDRDSHPLRNTALIRRTP